MSWRAACGAALKLKLRHREPRIQLLILFHTNMKLTHCYFNLLLNVEYSSVTLEIFVALMQSVYENKGFLHVIN